ncbi:Hypothetical protein LUCI_1068 [Lucifera butyrica]|uniref:Uncharacterized protein n=1 Tax=Lucifera butyrica TaxID=1351585 RepID=A0A498R4W2_9FIRM|nr:hypothetical protein [Lucifera butyrica]VBB05857.1 Hypothetical protein LUCI_1068 [Lucifera butyrica]
MGRETVSGMITSLLTWLLVPSLVIGFIYLLIHSESILLWSSLPLLAIIFIIKNHIDN